MATLLSLLAAAPRKGQWQCHLRPASGTRTWKLSWSRLGNCTLASRGRKVPVTPQATQSATTILATLPGNPGTAAGHVVMGGLEFMTTMAIVPSSNLSSQRWWQEVGNKSRRGPSACSSRLSNSPSSGAHRASSTFQTRSPHQTASISITRDRTFLCFAPSSCHASRAVVKQRLMAVPKTRVFESTDGAEDSCRLESVKREAQDVVKLVAKRRLSGRSKP